MQLPVKTILFYLLLHYMSLKPQEEQNKQYWNEIAITFLEKKYYADTIRRGFLIKIYSGSLPHELYFIALILQG